MLYYQLSNGECAEIRQGESSNEVEIFLFYGTTTITYEVDRNYTLNNIIEDIEKNYDKLDQEDLEFQMYANYD